MADADGSRLNLGSPVVPRGRGRPRGSKNRSNTTPATAGSSSAAPAKRCPGRPPGSKNKPKVTGAAPGPIAPPPATSAAPAAPLRIFSFFCIAAEFHQVHGWARTARGGSPRIVWQWYPIRGGGVV
jgi:hypothetical protein